MSRSGRSARLVLGIVAEHLHRAGTWKEKRGEDLGERRLARAVGAEETEQLSLFDAEIDLIERDQGLLALLAPEDASELLDLDGWDHAVA